MAPSRAVLITGCSSGIGQATALRLVRAGHPVYATARRPETLTELAAAGCHPLALDVTDEASMQAAVDHVVEREGAVGVLVNNAGYSQSGTIEETDLDRVRRQFETNVFGLVRLTQLVLPGMRAQGSGRIINLSSMGGRFTLPGGGFYHASKHAVEAISDALRFEVAGFGIEVVVVQPGLIRTRFADTAVGGMEALDDGSPYGAFHARLAQATHEVYEQGPLARLGGEPDDVARVIERALDAARPRARYTVTPSATVLLTTRRLLPDWGWDAFLRSNFPQPGVARGGPPAVGPGAA
jgi:NAD(P)-dependent dehydrogenase (short-subunit alcohol dehydrogenase family)